MTRYFFFGGKGGVGKTTCAAAFAASLRGRTLIVSTDPAHSLGDALAVKLSGSARQVRRGLFAAELDADRALTRWLSTRLRAFKEIASRGTYLDDSDIDSLLRLSLPGVDEFVALIELSRLARGFENVVVDTAPTGHTLRLLETPQLLSKLSEVLDDLQAKHRAMAEMVRGSSRRDREDEVIEELQQRASGLHSLLRSEAAEFQWVTLPEALPLAEASLGIRALRAAGMRVTRLIVNRVTQPSPKCALCSSRRRLESRVLAEAADLDLPLLAYPEILPEPRGLRSLGHLTKAATFPRSAVRSRAASSSGSRRREKAAAAPHPPTPRPPSPRVGEGGATPLTRLLFFGGKGGTGKSTAAAAAALVQARKTLLLSTDPAHSLADLLQTPIGDSEVQLAPHLHARELDAPAGFARRRDDYRSAIDELFAALRGGSRFDAPYDRAVMNDLIDLAPPGLDEIFALLAVIDALPRYELIVIDTAPTGHALRLLELVPKALEWVHALMQILLKYQRVIGLGQLAKDLTQTAHELRELQAILQDPRQTRFIAVTRAEELPRLETERLRKALRKLKIASPLVLVNALTPASACARCTRKARLEDAELKRSKGWVMLAAPACSPPPRGAKALRKFGETWTRISRE